jgi:hypothetical protein
MVVSLLIRNFKQSFYGQQSKNVCEYNFSQRKPLDGAILLVSRSVDMWTVFKVELAD